jgi:hypothetical protein
MSESTIGILVLLGISFVVSAVTHCFCHRFIFACFLSTLVAMLLFQFAVFLYLGHLDPFFPIGVAVCGIPISDAVCGSVSFVIALVVGAVVRRFRNRS